MRVGRRFTNTAIARRVAIECSRSRHAPSTRCQAPIIPSRRRNGVNEESARSRVDGARCHLRPYELCLVSAGRSSEGIYSGQSACMNCPVFRSAPMPLRTAQIEQPEQPEQPERVMRDVTSPLQALWATAHPARTRKLACHSHLIIESRACLYGSPTGTKVCCRHRIIRAVFVVLGRFLRSARSSFAIECVARNYCAHPFISLSVALYSTRREDRFKPRPRYTVPNANTRAIDV